MKERRTQIMRKNFILTLFLIMVMGLFLGNKDVFSGTGHNVSGHAWSENIGWISLNSTYGGGSYDYGVNIDPQSGEFSGHAWSENIGWISFDQLKTGSPPSDDPCGATCIAKVATPGGLGEGDVYIDGWARALAINDRWDGWIRFDHGKTGEVYIDINGDFHGSAWGSWIVGWINMNGANYKTIMDLTIPNQPPWAITFEAIQGDYCFFDNPEITLSWQFQDNDPGDFQIAYQIEIADNIGFDSSYVTPRIDEDSSSWTPEIGEITFDFGYTYYWRVIVWDSQDEASAPVTGPFFDTEDNQYPDTDFSFTPEVPAVGELVEFTDETTYYDTAKPRDWDFGDGGSSSDPNPTHSYNFSADRVVTLIACDVNDYCCPLAKPLRTSFPLPKWEETSP